MGVKPSTQYISLAGILAATMMIAAPSRGQGTIAAQITGGNGSGKMHF